jgi:hypothetical protein
LVLQLVIASDDLLEIKESVSPNEHAEASTAQQWLKHAPAPPSYGHFQFFEGTSPRSLLFRSSAHLPCALLLLRQRRVAAGSGLGIGLDTTITYVRP